MDPAVRESLQTDPNLRIAATRGVEAYNWERPKFMQRLVAKADGHPRPSPDS